MNSLYYVDKQFDVIEKSVMAMHDRRRQVILSEPDPLERQRLMHEHRAEMYEHLFVTRKSGASDLDMMDTAYEQRNDAGYE